MSKKLSKMSIAALVIAFSVAGSARAGDITGITGNGGVFNINPATINGEAGLREYTNFRLDQGEVANLIFKYGNQDISKFVNLVDNQININGLVNTVRNGQFYPGEAIFVSPNGMVVGESGVLNVGSLSVLTPTAPGMKMYKNGKATLEELGYHGNSNITINGMVLARNNVGMVARDLTVGPTGSVIAGMGTGYNSLVNNSQQAADLFNQLVNTGKNSSAASVEFRTYNRDGAGTNGMNIQGDVINHGTGDIVMINRGKEFNTSNGNITAHGGDVYLTNGSGAMNLNNKVTADSIYIAGGSEAGGITTGTNSDLTANDLVQIVHNGSGNTAVNGNVSGKGDMYITERSGNLNINGNLANQNGKIVIASNGSGLTIGNNAVISNNNKIQIANTGANGLTLNGQVKNSGSTAITNRAGNFNINGSVENTSGKMNITNTGNKLTLGASSSIVGGGDELLIQNTGAGGFEANGSIQNSADTYLQNTNGAMNVNGKIVNSGDVLYIANTRNGSGLTIGDNANISNDNSIQILNTGANGMKIGGNIYNAHNYDRGTAITNRAGNMIVNAKITSKDGNINLTNVGNGGMTIGSGAVIGTDIGKGELTIQNTGNGGLTIDGTVNNKGTAFVYNKAGNMNVNGKIVNSEGGLYLTNDGNAMNLNEGSAVRAAGIGSKLNILNRGNGGMKISGNVADTGKTLITNVKGDFDIDGVISNKSGQLNITNNGNKLNIAKDASISNDTNRIYITNKGAGGMNVDGQVVGKGHILLTNRAGGMNVTSNVTSGKANVVLTNTGNQNMNVSGTVTGQKVTATSKGNDMVIGNTETNQVALNGTQKVAITVENGSLKNAGSESDLIKTNGNLFINVTNGTIGEETAGKDLTKSINVNVGRRIKAFTNNRDGSNNNYSINMASENANMNVDRIKADGTLRLNTNGSILNASTDLENYANVKGTTVQLFAKEYIGTSDNALHFRQTDAAQQSNVIAGKDVNLHHRGEAVGENVNFGTIGSQTGNVTADIIRDGVIDNVVAPGTINVTSRMQNANLEIKNQSNDTSLIKDY